MLSEKVLSKTLVREKTLTRWKKYHESDLFQIRIMSLINFGPLIFFYQFKNSTPWVLESVQILGPQKKKVTKMPLKILWSKTLVRENTGVSEGENQTFFLIFYSGLNNLVSMCFWEDVLVKCFNTHYSFRVVWHK